MIRSADVLADPRYGLSAPYHGMPQALLYQAGDELQRTGVLAAVAAVYLALIVGVQLLERKLPV